MTSHSLHSWKAGLHFRWKLRTDILYRSTNLTPTSIILLAKPTGPQPVTKFRILCAHRFIHVIMCLPLFFAILRYMDPVHDTSSNFLTSHINVSRPSTPRSSKWASSFRSPPTKYCSISPLPYACHAIVL
jgi:hypothetical protein